MRGDSFDFLVIDHMLSSPTQPFVPCIRNMLLVIYVKIMYVERNAN